MLYWVTLSNGGRLVGMEVDVPADFNFRDGDFTGLKQLYAEQCPSRHWMLREYYIAQTQVVAFSLIPGTVVQGV